jgi:hypothetical protein
MTDVRERDDDEPEPPPFGGSPLSAPYATPIAFGSPPPEPVTLEGEIPWELREAVPFEDASPGDDA